METAQLCKNTYNNQLQQSIYLCHKRNMSQIWQVNTLWETKVKGHTMMHTYTHTHTHTHTHPNQCSYQVSTFYTLRNPRNSPDKILKLMVSTTRSNQGHTMTLHTYNDLPISLSSNTFLHLTVSEIEPG